MTRGALRQNVQHVHLPDHLTDLETSWGEKGCERNYLNLHVDDENMIDFDDIQGEQLVVRKSPAPSAAKTRVIERDLLVDMNDDDRVRMFRRQQRSQSV